MEDDERIQMLSELAQLDIDSAQAYERAIEHIDVVEIKQVLAEFKRDHQRHVGNLNAVIALMGGVVPPGKLDLKGFLIEGLISLRSRMGTEQALKAMRSGVRLSNKSYGAALAWDVPDEARAVIRAGAEDERRHLAYIEKTVAELERIRSRRAA